MSFNSIGVSGLADCLGLLLFLNTGDLGGVLYFGLGDGGFFFFVVGDCQTSLPLCSFCLGRPGADFGTILGNRLSKGSSLGKILNSGFWGCFIFI